MSFYVSLFNFYFFHIYWRFSWFFCFNSFCYISNSYFRCVLLDSVHACCLFNVLVCFHCICWHFCLKTDYGNTKPFYDFILPEIREELDAQATNNDTKGWLNLIALDYSIVAFRLLLLTSSLSYQTQGWALEQLVAFWIWRNYDSSSRKSQHPTAASENDYFVGADQLQSDGTASNGPAQSKQETPTYISVPVHGSTPAGNLISLL